MILCWPATLTLWGRPEVSGLYLMESLANAQWFDSSFDSSETKFLAHIRNLECQPSFRFVKMVECVMF